MVNVKDKTFSPSDCVPLDGATFINCKFEGSMLTYEGRAVHFKHCTFHSCSLVLGGPFAQAIEVLRSAGFDLVAVGDRGNRVIN